MQTQVIPYLRELVKGGHKLELLTFEPDDPGEQERSIKESLSADGIEWNWLRYHKRFSVFATAYDAIRGALFIHRRIGRNELEVLHARVHVPALMAALARKFSRRRPKLLFDIRGFMPEEYTDAGLWSEGGWLYRSVKRVEGWLMRESDGFVVLTEKARSILFPESTESGLDRSGRPIEVIPCCVDFKQRFTRGGIPEISVREELGLGNRFVVTHVGALTGLYLTEQIADLLKTAKDIDPSTFALFLTQTPPEEILSMLKARGYSESDIFVSKVSPTEVQRYLEGADVAVSFVKAAYSTASRSPTKIPEYLAAGLPIIANKGVGDVDEMLQTHGVGVVVDSFRPDDYAKALTQVRELGEVSARCRETAESEFDLETVGGVRYRRLYERLIGGTDGKS